MPNAAIAAVDLFCGVGGLTYGLERSGINVVAGVDVAEECRYAYEANTKARFVHRDVASVTGVELENWFGRAKVRLLAGCAPCQPFSSHTKGRDTSDDPKWPLLDEFARLVRETQPDFVTMENVVRIKRHAVFLRFISLLQRNRYSVTWSSVYCPDYGIPQARRRLVLLASRHGDAKLPSPTHTPKRYVTVEKAIGHLPPIQAGTKNPNDPVHVARSLSPLNLQRIQHSLPGGTWLDWPVELRSACHRRTTGASFQSVYARMEADQPAPTLTTQFHNFGTGRFGHPTQNRGLTLREGAILQSFPAKYKFCPPQGKVELVPIARLIGNAVPPRLGEIVGIAFSQVRIQKPRVTSRR